MTSNMNLRENDSIWYFDSTRFIIYNISTIYLIIFIFIHQKYQQIECHLSQNVYIIHYTWIGKYTYIYS